MLNFGNLVYGNTGVPSIARPSRKRQKKWAELWGRPEDALNFAITTTTTSTSTTTSATADQQEEGGEKVEEGNEVVDDGPTITTTITTTGTTTTSCSSSSGGEGKAPPGSRSKWKSLWWFEEGYSLDGGGTSSSSGSNGGRRDKGEQRLHLSFTVPDDDGGGGGGVVMKVMNDSSGREAGGADEEEETVVAVELDDLPQSSSSTTNRLELVKFWKDIPGGESEGEEEEVDEVVLTEEQDQVLWELKREQELLYTIMQKNMVVASKLHVKMCEAYDEAQESLPMRQKEYDDVMAYHDKMAKRFQDLAAERKREADDQNAMCAICQEGEAGGRNLIAFCDRCNVAVHTFCYYVHSLPEGNWYCRSCDDIRAMGLKESLERCCALCPVVGGAVISTDSGDWAHVSCCKWLGLVNRQGRVPTLPPRLQKLRRKYGNQYSCSVTGCPEPHYGGLVPCGEKGCPRFFHPSCGLSAKYEMYHGHRYQEMSWKAYCKVHSSRVRYEQTLMAIKGQYSEPDGDDMNRVYKDLWEDEDAEEKVVRRGVGKRPRRGTKEEQLYLACQEEIKRMDEREVEDKIQREREAARAKEKARAKAQGLEQLPDLIELPLEKLTTSIRPTPSEASAPIVFFPGIKLPHDGYDGSSWGMAGVMALADDYQVAVGMAMEQFKLIQTPVRSLAKELDRREREAKAAHHHQQQLEQQQRYQRGGGGGWPPSQSSSSPTSLLQYVMGVVDDGRRGGGNHDMVLPSAIPRYGREAAPPPFMYAPPPPPPTTNRQSYPHPSSSSFPREPPALNSVHISTSSSISSMGGRPPTNRRLSPSYDPDRRRRHGGGDYETDRRSYGSGTIMGGDDRNQRRIPGTGRFMCEYCAARITTKANLDRHKKDSCPVHVKGMPPPDNLEELLASAENVPSSNPMVNKREKNMGGGGGSSSMMPHGPRYGPDGSYVIHSGYSSEDDSTTGVGGGGGGSSSGLPPRPPGSSTTMPHLPTTPSSSRPPGPTNTGQTPPVVTDVVMI